METSYKTSCFGWLLRPKLMSGNAELPACAQSIQWLTAMAAEAEGLKIQSGKNWGLPNHSYKELERTSSDQ